MMKFVDTVQVAGTRIRDDGYLVADARVARSGIQLYAGYEIGKPDVPVVRVYRPADEVFNKESMASFAHRPVTNDHPTEAVTADNWKQYAVGSTSDEIAKDGEMLRVPLMVADAATIKDIQNGKRELSAGYSAELEWQSGMTADGQPYDAVQRNIRANHVAIVSRGRAGYKARIGDGGWDDAATGIVLDDRKEVKKMDLRKIMVDGLQVETTEAGEAAIAKLTKDRDAAVSALNDAMSVHDKAIADLNAQLAKKDAEIDSLKAAQLDDAALDARVVARADLIATAGKIAPNVQTTGLSDSDIKKAVVSAIRGADAMKDKPAAYIDAAFDILAEQSKGTEKLASALSDIKTVDVSDAKKQEDDAYNASVARFDRNRKKSA